MYNFIHLNESLVYKVLHVYIALGHHLSTAHVTVYKPGITT